MQGPYFAQTSRVEMKRIHTPWKGTLLHNIYGDIVYEQTGVKTQGTRQVLVCQTSLLSIYLLISV